MELCKCVSHDIAPLEPNSSKANRRKCIELGWGFGFCGDLGIKTSINLFACMSLVQNYFIDRWNLFDFVIVVGSIVDITMNEVSVSRTSTLTGKYTSTGTNTIAHSVLEIISLRSKCPFKGPF